jgi:acyl-CoA synthetase (AMP-forming)/AMP-acid ligase II
VRNPDASTIGEALIWQAAHRPEKRAFLFLERGERETESLTFGELDLRARAIAQALHDNKLRGQRVILAYPSCLEFVAALFGCFYAGAIAVPAPVASHGHSLARIRTILADAEAAAILSLRSLSGKEGERPSGTMGLHIPDVLCIATDEIANSGVCLPQPVDPGVLALLQYTSGSTGSPRGVMITHSNLIHNQRVLGRALASSAGDIAVSWLPLYHDMGLIGSVLHSVYAGAFCILMPPLSFMQKPIRWLKAIHRYRASISMAPCFAYNLCARRCAPGRDADLDLSSWRVAICGGEAIRPQMLDKFAETFRPAGFDAKALLPAYGLAEATLLATSSPAGSGMTTLSSPDAVAGDAGGRGHAWLRQLACCGQTWEEQRVAVVDPDSCRRLPPDQVGEIWLQGLSVAAGYWNRSEETRATFQAKLADELDSGSWLRTGDLGFLGPDGLFVTGRRKEIIVIHGVNYDPLDIETEACDSDPSLSSGGAAAFSIDRDDGEAVVLALEAERSALRSIDVNLLVGKVVSAVNRRFGLMIYDLVLLRPGTLPRTTSGKIQRHLCKELYLMGNLGVLPSIEHPALGRCRPHARTLA